MQSISKYIWKYRSKSVIFVRNAKTNKMYTEVINAKFKIGDVVINYDGEEYEVIDVYSLVLGVNKYIIENELEEWHEKETNLKLK